MGALQAVEMHKQLLGTTIPLPSGICLRDLRVCICMYVVLPQGSVYQLCPDIYQVSILVTLYPHTFHQVTISLGA